jgi:hypothetical protein
MFMVVASNLLRFVTDPFWNWITLALQAAILVFCLRSMFIALRRASVIMMVRRSAVPGFWKRNRDALMLAIFSALLGGILSLGASSLKDRYLPPPTASK